MMLRILAILLLSVSVCKGQGVNGICAQNYCKDSVFMPVNALPLVGKVVTSFNPITSTGWSFVSGPVTVAPGPGDSVWVTLPVDGKYVFQYKVVDSKSNMYLGMDTVYVIPLTVATTVITYMDSTKLNTKPIRYITTTFTNGSIKVTPVP